ncbi:MAG: hypothetical protein UU83_C0038G0001 [Candidatus Jorgensenbacteria bacterium GW2011_GWF2_41_8]|uniref:Uncharacterized protein n=1 Tax=Candidatus Jorgensenbacteria bacterium GW2011_GWF2_41_8 TaxID=1618667 RepID=A0A0G0ZP94_9BACT|nr:MAG: hypothetical protein UU83_C0038G0001 [Candidatus Jorgensenbacteria bacterium GW2011_GWF2_41_8]
MSSTRNTGMKKPAYPGPLVGKIFYKIAPRIGARVLMEREWNIAGQIIYPNGQKRYCSGTHRTRPELFSEKKRIASDTGELISDTEKGIFIFNDIAIKIWQTITKI